MSAWDEIHEVLRELYQLGDGPPRDRELTDLADRLQACLAGLAEERKPAGRPGDGEAAELPSELREAVRREFPWPHEERRLAVEAALATALPAYLARLRAEWSEAERTDPLKPSADPEIEQVWQAYWREIVAPGGVLDVEQVKRELYDFRSLMRATSQVFDHVTGGRVSKPNTDPSVVTAMADDYYAECHEIEPAEPAPEGLRAVMGEALDKPLEWQGGVALADIVGAEVVKKLVGRLLDALSLYRWRSAAAERELRDLMRWALAKLAALSAVSLPPVVAHLDNVAGALTRALATPPSPGAAALAELAALPGEWEKGEPGDTAGGKRMAAELRALLRRCGVEPTP